MDVTDWKLTLYPSEEEDEITRLRRDEMEVNIAQRMSMLGYHAELLEEGTRHIRFVYQQPPPPPPGQPQQPPMGGGMGMPMGGMQMGGGMGTPGALPGRNIPPQLAGAMGGAAQAGMANPGGQGMGMRNRGPASPQNRSTMGAGSPISSVQQRGPIQGPMEQTANAVQNAGRYRGA